MHGLADRLLVEVFSQEYLLSNNQKFAEDNSCVEHAGKCTGSATRCRRSITWPNSDFSGARFESLAAAFSRSASDR